MSFPSWLSLLFSLFFSRSFFCCVYLLFLPLPSFSPQSFSHSFPVSHSLCNCYLPFLSHLFSCVYLLFCLILLPSFSSRSFSYSSPVSHFLCNCCLPFLSRLVFCCVYLIFFLLLLPSFHISFSLIRLLYLTPSVLVDSSIPAIYYFILSISFFLLFPCFSPPLCISLPLPSPLHFRISLSSSASILCLSFARLIRFYPLLSRGLTTSLPFRAALNAHCFGFTRFHSASFGSTRFLCLCV